jgi:hypothetical protein
MPENKRRFVIYKDANGAARVRRVGDSDAGWWLLTPARGHNLWHNHPHLASHALTETELAMCGVVRAQEMVLEQMTCRWPRYPAEFFAYDITVDNALARIPFEGREFVFDVPPKKVSSFLFGRDDVQPQESVTGITVWFTPEFFDTFRGEIRSSIEARLNRAFPSAEVPSAG